MAAPSTPKPSAASDLASFLSSHKLSDLPQPRPHVICVPAGTAPTEAFKILVDNNILSAPVYDEYLHHYWGFLDLRDLISFAVFAEENAGGHTLNEIIGHGVKMFRHPETAITTPYLARRHSFTPVPETATLADVASILASGVHRVPVLKAGQVLDIISQSNLISYIYGHLKDIPSLAHIHIADMRIGTSPVLAVKHSTSVFETFKLLDSQGKTGTAVVDDHGAILTSTCGKDLKLWLMAQSAGFMKMSIFDFLKEIRKREIYESALVVTVRESDTLGFLVGKLHATRSHRVFVIDAHDHPIKVISLTDILSWVFRKSA